MSTYMYRGIILEGYVTRPQLLMVTDHTLTSAFRNAANPAAEFGMTINTNMHSYIKQFCSLTWSPGIGPPDTGKWSSHGRAYNTAEWNYRTLVLHSSLERFLTFPRLLDVNK